MSTDSLKDNKKKLRAEYLAAREKLDAGFSRRAAEQLAAKLLEIIPFDSGIVAAYLAHRNEIGLADAMEKLHARGHALCLPVVVREQAPLAFRSWKPGAALEKGLYGIEVPLSSEEPVMPDTVLVPLVAFDKNGHRLGYGSGYYDHTISRLRETKKSVRIIGVAYSVQQADALPGEPHDQKLDEVVTEKEVFRFS